MRGTLKTWYSFYDGYQPDFSWWLKKPYDEASSALESYAKYLREEVAEVDRLLSALIRSVRARLDT